MRSRTSNVDVLVLRFDIMCRYLPKWGGQRCSAMLCVVKFYLFHCAIHSESVIELSTLLIHMLQQTDQVYFGLNKITFETLVNIGWEPATLEAPATSPRAQNIDSCTVLIAFSDSPSAAWISLIHQSPKSLPPHTYAS